MNNCRNVTENPCNMCMPMGGIIPFKGIEQSMVLLHGSQGCATYMRRHIAEHFNEPIDVASSSLNEKGTVYGGEKNLKQGLDNVIRVYKPKLIGVLTTCLAETIGEDIDRITESYLTEKGNNGLPIVTVSTPGYGCSHSEGYWLALRRIVQKLAQKTPRHSKINVIVPNVSPADIREIKRMLQLMQVEFTLLPDFSETLDSPFTRPYVKIPAGGTKIKDIINMSGAAATIEMGLAVEDNMSPGKYLEEKFGVPVYHIPVPIGMENTDIFFQVLKRLSREELPESLKKERGRLQDAMIDSHKYNFQGKSIIFGDPEIIYAVTKTCLENGVYPVAVATGSKTQKLAQILAQDMASLDIKFDVINESDFAQIRLKAKLLQANIALGHSDGKYLTETEGIPLVRIGFPIHDRVGGQRLMSVGYTGTTMLLDRITNTLLENKYQNYRRLMYDQFFRNSRKIRKIGSESRGVNG
ncbi:MAG: nitrogenase component 1 [Dehalobacterium sp.]